MVDNNSVYSESPLADIVALRGSCRKGRWDVPEGQNGITNVTLHIVAGDWTANRFAVWNSPGASSHYGVASDGQIVQIVSEANTAYTNGGGQSIKSPFSDKYVCANANAVTIEISNLSPDCFLSRSKDTFVARNGQEYNYKGNQVEINGEYYTYAVSNEALDSTIKLVADIAKRNNLGELYHDGINGTLRWHADYPGVSHNICPGDYVMKMTDYIIECANEINEKGFYIPDSSVAPDGGNGLMQFVTTGENPFEDGTISSSMYTVVDSVNKIRGSISGNESISATQKPIVSSSSTIPGELFNAHSSLFSISSDLVSTLNQETKIITSVAQTYFEMDQYLSKETENLSDGSSSVDTSAYVAKVDELLKTDLTSATSFSSYMFSPSSHVEGNSGKICLSDINSMLSGNSLTGPLYENLSSERTSAKETKNQIDSLIQNITSHNELKGNAWDTVAAKLGTYSDLMNTRIESCDIMEAATVKALKLIKDYMGEYEELDDSKLPELRQKVIQLKQDIETAQNIINETKLVTYSYKDDEDKTREYTITQYVYSAASRREAMATIERTKKLIIECEKEIEKLEGLPIVLAQAEQIMNDALSEIYSKYGVKVSDVVTGKEASFVPPTNTSYTGTYSNSDKTFDVEREIPEGKVSREQFDQSLGLQNEYGTYNDYLNGVRVKDNPMYNASIKDNGTNLDGTSANPDLNNENGESASDENNPGNEELNNNAESNTGNNNSENTNTENNTSNNNSNNNVGNNNMNNNSGNDSSNNNSENTNTENNTSNNNSNNNVENNNVNNNSGNDSSNNNSENTNTENNTSNNNSNNNVGNNNVNNNSGNDSSNNNSENTNTENNTSNNNSNSNVGNNIVNNNSGNDSSNNNSENTNTENNTSNNNSNNNVGNNNMNNNSGNDSSNNNSENTNTENNTSNNNSNSNVGNNNTGNNNSNNNMNNNTGNNTSNNNSNNNMNNNTGNNTSNNNSNNNMNNNTGNDSFNNNIDSNSGNNESYRPSNPSIDSNVNSNPSVPDTGVNDGVIDGEYIPSDKFVDDDGSSYIPPVVEIPDDEIIDITPEDVVQDTNDLSNNETSDLAKKIAIGVGVGAVASAAALGAHTYSKAKKNNIYEDD